MRGSTAVRHPGVGGGGGMVPEDDLTPLTPATGGGADPGPSKVRHVPPLGSAAAGGGGDAGSSKIRGFTQTLGAARTNESTWKRRPTTDGQGAVRVKSFHCKLTGDSLEFLDQQINEWLDAHPEYEVKHVTTCVGDWTGKLREPALIVNLWM